MIYFDWLVSADQEVVLLNCLLDEEEKIVTPEMFLVMDYVYEASVALFDRWGNEQCVLILPPSFVGRYQPTRYITPQNLKIEFSHGKPEKTISPITA